MLESLLFQQLKLDIKQAERCKDAHGWITKYSPSRIEHALIVPSSLFSTFTCVFSVWYMRILSK